MRCASQACETSVRAMENFARANVGSGKTSENQIWAILHAENINRDGEWIETRLLSSGQRTNLWFQECGLRITQPNEIISFDTDLVGAYGICVDISRSWWIGNQKPTGDMVYAIQHAHEHIMTNMEMLKPGVMVPKLSANAHRLDDKFQAQKYGCLMHGVGLCDEWPLVAYPDKTVPGNFDYPLEAGMVLCVEEAVGKVGGSFTIKLEDQVLITEDGFENLTKYPFDASLMAIQSILASIS